MGKSISYLQYFQLLSSSSYLSVYTGLALNFECDNNAFFAIAYGAKFGVGGDKLNLKTPIISPYVRLTFGETLVEKEFYSMSVMLDLEYQYNIFDNALKSIKRIGRDPQRLFRQAYLTRITI